MGGQPTVGFDINLCEIARACGYAFTATVQSIEGITEALESAKKMPGPHFIDIHVRPGNRKNIGRPTSSPAENKNSFMRHLAE